MTHKFYSDHNGETRLGDIEMFLEIALDNYSKAFDLLRFITG